MDEQALEKIMKISEDFFDTENDPEQIPISLESLRKLQNLHPKTFVCREENGEPLSWIVVLSTSRELENKFLGGEISERELLDLSKKENRYEAIYLCFAFTQPSARRRGLTIQLFKEALAEIPKNQDVEFFAWPYSEEGRLMLEKLAQELEVGIKMRS